MRKSCKSAQLSIKNISFIIRGVFVVVVVVVDVAHVFCVSVAFVDSFMLGTLNGELFQNRLPGETVTCQMHRPNSNGKLRSNVSNTVRSKSLRTVLYTDTINHYLPPFCPRVRFGFGFSVRWICWRLCECLRTVQHST